MGLESTELIEEPPNNKMHRKNAKNMVHLQPLDHHPHTRNSSVPPQYGGISSKSAVAPHPLNFAPSPN